MNSDLCGRVRGVVLKVLSSNADVYSTLNPSKAELASIDSMGLRTVLEAADVYNYMVEHDEQELNGVSIGDAHEALRRYCDSLASGQIPECECLRRLRN